MKLSDAFINAQEEPLCELKVRFMNIVFRYQSELKKQPTKEEMEGCYDKAIKEAISRGILVDYLTRKGTEVRNMFFGEYDYDLDMKVKAQEAAEEKAVEAAILMIKKYNADPETAAKDMNAPLELVLERLKKQITV